MSRLLVAAVMLFTASTAYAQSPANAAPLAGTVLDPDGRAVAGAHVEAIDEQGVVRAAADSAQDGGFTLRAPAGRYVLTIRAEGFAPRTETVTIPDPSPTAREFAMTVARVREDVTVTATVPASPLIASGTKTSTPL